MRLALVVDIFLQQLFRILLLWFLCADWHWAQIIRLYFLLDHFVVSRYELRFDDIWLEFVPVNVLWGLRNHLKHVKLLLLTQLQKFPKFFCTHLLPISCHMVNLLTNYQPLLFAKSVQILIQLQRIIVTRRSLELKLGRLLLLGLVLNLLPLLELISLLLLTGHRVPYPFHFVLAVVRIVLEILLVVLVAVVVMAHPGLVLGHLVAALHLVLSGGHWIGFHPGRRSDVRPHIHFVNWRTLLGVHHLVPSLEHLGLILMGQRPLVPLIISDVGAYFLFHYLWAKVFFLDQSLRGGASEATPRQIIVQPVGAVLALILISSILILTCARWLQKIFVLHWLLDFRYLFLTIRCCHYESFLLNFHWFCELFSSLDPTQARSRWRCVRWHAGWVLLIWRRGSNLLVCAALILLRSIVSIVVVFNWRLQWRPSLLLQRHWFKCKGRFGPYLGLGHRTRVLIHGLKLLCPKSNEMCAFPRFEFGLWSLLTPYLK